LDYVDRNDLTRAAFLKFIRPIEDLEHAIQVNPNPISNNPKLVQTFQKVSGLSMKRIRREVWAYRLEKLAKNPAFGEISLIEFLL